MPGTGRDGPLTRWALEHFAAPLHETLRLGLARTSDYQDATYARRYLERLQGIYAAERSARGAKATLTQADCAVTLALAAKLAVWMTYEDLPRVAQLKARAGRLEAIRLEKGARVDEPVHVTEFFRPGSDELAGLLPPRAARAVHGLARRWPRLKNGFGLRLRSDTVFGLLALRMLGAARRYRPSSSRFATENALIERWLAAIAEALALDPQAALAVVELAGLNKGYSATFERGRQNFLAIFEELVVPQLAEGDATHLAQRLAAARGAALADPGASALGSVLVAAPTLSPKSERAARGAAVS